LAYAGRDRFVKRIAVVGATGFLGSAIVRRLAAEGIEVLSLVRAGSDRSAVEGASPAIRIVDIMLPDTLRGAFSGLDAVVHAAGMLGRAGVPEAAYHELHVEGTRNILAEAAHCEPPPRLLHISSPGVLGPIAGEPADETAPLAPSNAYERSKAEAEQLAAAYAAGGLPVVIARPEFVYGPGDRHVLGLFRAVQRRLFFYVNGGRHTCHPTYIEDAVDGLLRCLRSGQSGEIYHIAGPRPVTFRELGETLAGALGVPSPWISFPKPVTWGAAMLFEAVSSLLGREAPLSRTGVAFFSESRRFSWQKAHQELGYSPQYDLDRGSRATVEWYRQQGWL